MEMVELSTFEMQSIDGGANVYRIITGTMEVLGGAALAVAAVGTSSIPVAGPWIAAGGVIGGLGVAADGVKNIYRGFKE